MPKPSRGAAVEPFAELADSFGIIGPDGQDRVVTKEEFVEGLLAQA